jgi:enamine deaminase RidA (YjgF/YER057c/UK114 family)
MSGRLELVQPDGWPRGAGYAHGVVGAGRVICIAGQVGWDPVTLVMAGPDFAAQVDRALANIVAVLDAAGAQPTDVARMTWYITDRQGYLEGQRAIGHAYRRHFAGHYPAMSVVVVAGLIEPGAVVEIEATAIVAGPAQSITPTRDGP